MNHANRPSRHHGVVTSKAFVAFLALSALSFGGLGLPKEGLARQNSVSGGLSLGSDYNSNVFKTDVSLVEEWKSQMAPQLSFASKGLTDSLSLTYAPQFGYNHRRDADETSHNLSLLADKGLTSRWKVKVTGNYSTVDNLYFEPINQLGAQGTTRNFLRADAATQAEVVRLLFPELPWDPALHMGYVVSLLQQRYGASTADQGQVDILLTQGLGGARQRYWTSAMGVVSEYEFAEKSVFTVGYRFASQDNSTGLLADRITQMPSLLLSYQFTQKWRAALGYDLKIDTVDTANDSTSNSPHLQVDYQLSPKDQFSWNYQFQRIAFSGASSGTTTQDSKVGWTHALDQRTAVTSTLGASYLNHELSADEREYSLDLGVSRSFERGVIALTGKGTNAVANSTGAWKRSRQSWELGSDLTYQWRQDLSSTGRLSYGKWDADGQVVLAAAVPQSAYDRLQFGAGLGYAFMRWYTLSLDYDYNVFNTESITMDDYTEHLVSIKLAAAKELWRW